MSSSDIRSLSVADGGDGESGETTKNHSNSPPRRGNHADKVGTDRPGINRPNDDDYSDDINNNSRRVGTRGEELPRRNFAAGGHSGIGHSSTTQGSAASGSRTSSYGDGGDEGIARRTASSSGALPRSKNTDYASNYPPTCIVEIEDRHSSGDQLTVQWPTLEECNAPRNKRKAEDEGDGGRAPKRIRSDEDPPLLVKVIVPQSINAKPKGSRRRRRCHL